MLRINSNRISYKKQRYLFLYLKYFEERFSILAFILEHRLNRIDHRKKNGDIPFLLLKKIIIYVFKW